MSASGSSALLLSRRAAPWASRGRRLFPATAHSGPHHRRPRSCYRTTPSTRPDNSPDASKAASSSHSGLSYSATGSVYRPVRPLRHPRADTASSRGDVQASASDSESSRPTCEEPQLIHQCIAEAAGTFLVVLFGCGSVCAAIFTGAQVGLWQVAAVWGWGVAIAIYCTASISGAHLNPAVSLAFAVTRSTSFPWAKLLPYCFSQLTGAILAGMANLFFFGSLIARFEANSNIVRGTASSVASAAAFGEYFPNPGMFPGETFVTPAMAFCVEAWGTGVLAFVIWALTDERNKVLGPHRELAPLIIGFTVAVLISVYAPLTQAGWNPARDLGPRLVAYFAGWGSVALPGPQNGFWIYILGPMVGAVLGGLIHDKIVVSFKQDRSGQGGSS